MSAEKKDILCCLCGCLNFIFKVYFLHLLTASINHTNKKREHAHNFLCSKKSSANKFTLNSVCGFLPVTLCFSYNFCINILFCHYYHYYYFLFFIFFFWWNPQNCCFFLEIHQGQTTKIEVVRSPFTRNSQILPDLSFSLSFFLSNETVQNFWNKHNLKTMRERRGCLHHPRKAWDT